jgi:tetratricopeptide repeat protein 21B
VPCILVLTLAKLADRKTTEARNFMKKVAADPHDIEFGEEQEQLWLLSADSFIAIQKFDSAEDMLRKILRENKSCGKAEELLGLIKEKEQSYVDAAQHYHRAYELTQHKSASIGFRLSFNYLKAKEYIPCI